MTPATNNRRPIKEIVTALKAALIALQTVDVANRPSPLFERVEIFDDENLVAAFQTLMITEQRICLVVPLTEKFEIIFKHPRLQVKRTLPVALLVSDSVAGSRAAAFLGDDDNMGASALADLALPAVMGQLISNPNGVVSTPTSIMAMNIRDTEKKLPDRITVVIELDCTGGWLETTLDRGPSL